jgi:hypothetical protein
VDDDALTVLTIAEPQQARDDPALAIERVILLDFNRDGVDEILVIDWSGGAHCWFPLTVFSVAPTLRVLGVLDGRHTGLSLTDRDMDAVPEIHLNDWTFEYWKASFTESPSPPVVLGFGDGAFVPDVEMMQQPPPDEITFKKLIDNLREEEPPSDYARTANDLENPWWPVPPLLWREVLELVYTGNADAAWRLIDAWWPNEKRGKDEFRKALIDQMAKGPCWSRVKTLNRW